MNHLSARLLDHLMPSTGIQSSVKMQPEVEGVNRLGAARVFANTSLLALLLLSAAALGAHAQEQEPGNPSVVPTQPVTPPAGSMPAAKKPVDEWADAGDNALDPASLLPELPALPREKASLVGGTIDKLDRVRDEFTVQVFGGGKMKMSYDPRTRIYQNGVTAAASDLREGDRVYVDTILSQGQIFACNIRLKTNATAGASQGMILSYRSDKGELLVRDSLSPEPLKIRLTSGTLLVKDGHPASTSELEQGTLVAVQFGSEKDGHAVAREVSVLATPGSNFTFGGEVAALDLSIGLMVLNSSSGHKTYEIYLDPSIVAINHGLRPGASVTAVANYDGSRYVARSLTVDSK